MGSSSGVVLSLFRDGFYVSAGESIFALTGPSVAPGPLHVTLARSMHSIGFEAQVGEAVVRRSGRIELRRCSIDVSSAERWAPQHRADEIATALPLILTDGRASDVPPDVAAVWPETKRSLATGDLVAVRDLLGGRGSGLTPAGDDVLAGLLLTQALLAPAQCDQLVQLAAGTPTGDLSLRFLHWAALGMSIEPVHRLVDAAASGDPARMRRAVTALCSIGASSGQALLFGLAAGQDHRSARRPRVAKS